MPHLSQLPVLHREWPAGAQAREHYTASRRKDDGGPCSFRNRPPDARRSFPAMLRLENGADGTIRRPEPGNIPGGAVRPQPTCEFVGAGAQRLQAGQLAEAHGQVAAELVGRHVQNRQRAQAAARPGGGNHASQPVLTQLPARRRGGGADRQSCIWRTRRRKGALRARHKHMLPAAT